jgi:hypothetical protein
LLLLLLSVVSAGNACVGDQLVISVSLLQDESIAIPKLAIRQILQELTLFIVIVDLVKWLLFQRLRASKVQLC